MNKFWIFALGGLLCACSGNEKESAYTPSVYVVTPENRGNSGERIFAGVVEEAHDISLGFKTAGQLKKIYVKEGDHVRQGQLLAELDDADYRLGVEALQIQYDQVSDEVARAKRLYEKKSMSANDYEKASAGLRQLGVQLQVNKNKLEYTRLYSPVSGIVESVNFSPAEMVDAGTAVFTLLDVSRMEVVADIPAKTYMNRGNIGAVTCRQSQSGGRIFPMQIVSIVPKADSNQLYRMRLSFGTAADSRITPGMNVEVSLKMLADSTQSVALPISTLFRHDNADCVWVLQADSTVTRRPVTVDPITSGRETVITSGLTGNESIVRAGVNMLHEGEKVRVIDEPSETNAGGIL